MVTAAHLLETKGFEIWSISSTDTVRDALSILADRNVGALPVLDGGELVGMFSERDYARKVALVGRTSPETLVGEIMSTHVTSVRPDTSIVDCMELMSEKHVRHLPVCEGGDPVGLISIGDVVKALLSEKEFLIRQLEKYIAGSR